MILCCFLNMAEMPHPRFQAWIFYQIFLFQIVYAFYVLCWDMLKPRGFRGKHWKDLPLEMLCGTVFLSCESTFNCKSAILSIVLLPAHRELSFYYISPSTWVWVLSGQVFGKLCFRRPFGNHCKRCNWMARIKYCLAWDFKGVFLCWNKTRYLKIS